MLKKIFAKKKDRLLIERYAALIFYIVKDIKNIDHMVQIYNLAEMLWQKEKRENSESAVQK